MKSSVHRLRSGWLIVQLRADTGRLPWCGARPTL
jgi:hypothetical protein